MLKCTLIFRHSLAILSFNQSNDHWIAFFDVILTEKTCFHHVLHTRKSVNALKLPLVQRLDPEERGQRVENDLHGGCFGTQPLLCGTAMTMDDSGA